MADAAVRSPAAIRAGIERARQEIEQSVTDLRTNFSQSLNWRRFVRRHPARCFFGAVVVGLLAAKVVSR